MEYTIKIGEKYKGKDDVIVQIIYLDIIGNKINLNALNLFECGITEYDCKTTAQKFQKWIHSGEFEKVEELSNK